MPQTCTAFLGTARIAQGTPAELIEALRDREQGILVFDDATGRPVDLDWRGIAPMEEESAPPPRRGRPKLGVVAREITLLPRQWDWLAEQPGGASQTLRRLVDEARKAGKGHAARRIANERTYRVMAALGGDLPGFEEASRLLFANDRDGFACAIAAWSKDLGDYLLALSEVREEDVP
jgi:hypothetical protein